VCLPWRKKADLPYVTDPLRRARITNTATSANDTDKGPPNSNRTFCKDFIQLRCAQIYNAGRYAAVGTLSEDYLRRASQPQPRSDLRIGAGRHDLRALRQGRDVPHARCLALSGVRVQ